MPMDSSAGDRARWLRGQWHDDAAAACPDELALRVLTSRVLGGDASLALYGGGNTSIKTAWSDGRACLFVKGSGADLADVTAADFVPVDLVGARALLDGPPLDNAALDAALAPLCLDRTRGKPSIETLLHACLPHRFVEHTHADAILAVMNTASGEARVAEVFGDAAPLVPFRHSGFELARAVSDVHAREARTGTIGLILAHHGVVAFGDTARESFDNLYALVMRAEAFLRARGAWDLPEAEPPVRTWQKAIELARLRLALSRLAGFPLALSVDDSPVAVAFSRRADVGSLARRGPPTPQHAVFTKRFACLGQDVAAYGAEYRRYVADHGAGLDLASAPDPAPRILIDPDVGVIAASVDITHARMTANVYRHDIEIFSRAEAHDRYSSLPPEAVLAAEVHYGGFDRRRLARRAADLPLLGCLVGVPPEVDTLVPGLVSALAQAGADVIPFAPDDDRAAIELAYGHGGLDACLLPAGATPSARTEALLALSPAGGIVTELDEHLPVGVIRDGLAARWHVGLEEPA